MKKLFYLLLTFLLFIPILISASSYSSSTSTASRYINNFLNPNRYIKINSGNLISKEEVEKTIVRPNMTVSSYMYDGTKFWAKDKYVIGETIEQRPQNENYKTKVTEIVLYGTKVKGTGKYTDPWIFVDSYKVTVFTNANGKIDGEQSVTKNVDSNGNVTFTIEPNSGYKYLNNNCGGTSEVAGNILTIRNVEKDISCSVSFEASKYSNTLPVPYKTVHINLTNSNVTYRFDNPSPSPNTFSSIYLQGYYTDDTLKTRIGKLTNVPSRKGWTFNGYYVKRSNFSKLDEIASTDELLINNKGFFETTYGLLKDNTTKEVIGFSIEPNKYKISFNKTGGTGGTPYVENWPYEHDMPVITIPGKPGYVFAGYYTATNGGGDKYYDETGKASRIFNPSTLGTLNLYAKWEECGTGKYCPGDNVKHECPNGYKNTATTTSTTCTQCRYWDSCKTGHNTCSYGCSTCTTTTASGCNHYCWGNYGCTPSGCTGASQWCCSLAYTTTTYSCNCSSCYYGENTCSGGWVFNTSSCISGVTYNVSLNQQTPTTEGTNFYQVIYYGSHVLIEPEIFTIPTKEGYVFGGYYTEKNGSGTKIVDMVTSTTGRVIVNDIKTSGATQSGGSYVLYAYWIPCDKGLYCPGDNESYLCPKGTYQDETGNKICKTCPAGKIASEEGSQVCSNCPYGTYQDEQGKTSCKDCAAGSYQDQEGQNKCKICSVGSISGIKASYCTACNDGKTTTAHGKDNCDANCSNSANAGSWETATWNSNNTVTNACKIKSCETGYRLDNNVCVRSTFTVTYNSNGGSGTMSDSTATYDDNFVTRKNTFTKSGYKFIGWNEKSDGSGVAWNLTSNGVYENGNGTHPWKWTYEKDITLYAQWEKIKEFVAVTNSSTVSKIQTGSCDGSGCYKMLYASITGISCTNNSNNTTTCVFSTKVEQTGGINTYANTMYLRILNGSTDINSTSCEIKPYTSNGEPDTWNRTCSISFATPTANVTYKYRAIVNNNGCILDGRIRNTAWGNCNELTGYIKNY